MIGGGGLISKYAGVIGQQVLMNSGASTTAYLDHVFETNETGRDVVWMASFYGEPVVNSPLFLIGVHRTLKFTQSISAATAKDSNSIYRSAFAEQFRFAVDVEEDPINRAIRDLQANLERSYVDQLAHRLTFLSVPGEPDEQMSPASLTYFASFIQKHRLKYPDLVLSPEGNIRAEWRVDKIHQFIVEFLPSGLAQFLVFVPNSANTEQVEKIGGRVQLGKLADLMEVSRAKEWCFE